MIQKQRGRKTGTQNRDKATLQAEKIAKELRANARRALGFPPRGKLSFEQKKQLDQWIFENSE